MENNIKRATSKDSETSDDRSPETIKRRKIKWPLLAILSFIIMNMIEEFIYIFISFIFI